MYVEGVSEPPRGMIQGTTNCMTCCGLYVVALAQKEQDDSVVLPEVHPAATWVPDWQKTMIMGTMIVQAVAVPTCLGHMTVAPKTAEQKAMEGGILLGQAGGK